MIRGEGNDDKCNNVRLIRLMKRWSSSIHPSCSLTCAAEHRVGMKPDMSRGMPNWDSTVIKSQNYSHVMFSAVDVTIRYKIFGGCCGTERSLDWKG
jgi:methionine synthase I (cobalamin-dependent)